MSFSIHLVQGQKVISKPIITYLPRVGEIIRLSPTRFYEVKTIVWCWDEPGINGTRVNILVKKERRK